MNEGTDRVESPCSSHLAMPKSSKTHSAGVIGEDIRRLEIPMHDQLAVGKSHGIANLQEEV